METREKPSTFSPPATQHPLAAFVLQGSEGSAAALRRDVHCDASRLDVGAQLLVCSLHGRVTFEGSGFRTRLSARVARLYC